ncbi:MAG: SagB family peptide dehydrogenase [Acidobacteriota bacterium]
MASAPSLAVDRVAAPAQTTRSSEHPASRFDPSRRHSLSRFATLRPGPDGELVADSPTDGRLLSLRNATQVALVLRFLEPQVPDELVAGLDAARREALLDFFGHCHDAGLLVPVDDAGREARHDALAHWEVHDLAFHARSRRGRTPFAVGAISPPTDALEPEPAFKAPAAALSVSLPKGRTASDEPTLTAALEARRSLYRTTPVDLDDLGAFLYRTSRVTAVRTTADGDSLLQRVYPSGGALHALELYVIPTRCRGLDPGVYHYRPREHALVAAAGPGPDVDHLLEEARHGTGRLEDAPSVLLVLSARFRRVARKYQGLSYALVLKEVGAAFQTFYLVATALGLAPCAIGTGNSDRFARALGIDYYTESSVGEFILGGREA